MIFAVSSINFLLIGLFWVWFIWQHIRDEGGGQTAVSVTDTTRLPLTIMAVLWFVFAVILWRIYLRLRVQDANDKDKVI